MDVFVSIFKYNFKSTFYNTDKHGRAQGNAKGACAPGAMNTGVPKVFS
jgi:hypothetical protein